MGFRWHLRWSIWTSGGNKYRNGFGRWMVEGGPYYSLVVSTLVIETESFLLRRPGIQSFMWSCKGLPSSEKRARGNQCSIVSDTRIGALGYCGAWEVGESHHVQSLRVRTSLRLKTTQMSGSPLTSVNANLRSSVHWFVIVQ